MQKTIKQEQKDRDSKAFRRGSYAGFILACLPCVAQAAAPFQPVASTLQADLASALAPVAGIALIVVALLCFFGKISWMWLVGLIVGIVLFFGRDQIISWIRGAASV